MVSGNWADGAGSFYEKLLGFYSKTNSWLSVDLEEKYAIRRTLFMIRPDCCMTLQKVTSLVGNESGTQSHEVCGTYEGASGQSIQGQIGAITCSRLLVGSHVTFDLEITAIAAIANLPAGLVRVAVFGLKLP